MLTCVAAQAIYTSECIFVFIFAVLLKERFHLPKFMSVMVTAGGVVVVTLFARGKEESGVEQNVFGYMAVTASVTTFALFEVLYERFAGEDDAAAAEGAQSKGAASPAAYTKAGAEGEGGEQNVWNGDLEVGGGEDDAVQHNQPVVHGALARTPEKLLSELAGETDGSDALRQALLGEVDIPEESEVITLPSHLSTARPVQLSPESRSVGSSPIFSRPVVAKGKVLAPPSPLSLGQSLANSHKSSRRMERKASDASADDELQDTAEKMEKESGEESSILEDVMESLLFIGAIGAATVLLQWIPVPILHFTGYVHIDCARAVPLAYCAADCAPSLRFVSRRVEPFEWPSHVLDLLFLNMGLDAFNNIGVIVAISLSSALYVSVLSVLTAPLSIAADIVLHHYSMPPLSFVGNALVLLGFFAYSVIEFRQESDESEPHRHIGSRVVARSAPRKQRRRNRAYSV